MLNLSSVLAEDADGKKTGMYVFSEEKMSWKL